MTISNRKYNIIRHINRKHPGTSVPENMLPHLKNGRYLCPSCPMTSNRRYNLKEHIRRKHPGTKIPENLVSATTKILTNPSLLSEMPPPVTDASRLNYPYYFGNLPSPLMSDSKREKHSDSFFKKFTEYIAYSNFIQNQINFQNSVFLHNHPNILDNNSSNLYYEPMPNLNFGQPFLFKIYKCTFCFNDLLHMFPDLNSIKPSNEYKCCFNTSIIPRINKENKNITDPKIKGFSLFKIFSIIENKLYPKAKLCLKTIKIPRNFHHHFHVDLNQFISDEINSKKPKGFFPPWLQKLLILEDFIELENTVENDWSRRLITSKEDIIEISREELIRIINLSNSTFGLFKYQEDQNQTSLFFTYLQLEKEI